ncbi:stage VI sporulation protein F [Sediminibacillus massiliensis]|uniref:stage VI sporulation protein F n=1 Tax=Sediminibacillus massiliensis TaxID=1926277 RepID=UPI0009886B7F|nr:stage VI sporulation protein F [Sediminibacillus massiliensis]
MDQEMLKRIEKQTGVDMRAVTKLANAVGGKDLKDERTARQLVRQVGKLAGKRVPKQTEDMIVKMLQNSNISESTIKKMMK